MPPGGQRTSLHPGPLDGGEDGKLLEPWLQPTSLLPDQARWEGPAASGAQAAHGVLMTPPFLEMHPSFQELSLLPRVLMPQQQLCNILSSPGCHSGALYPLQDPCPSALLPSSDHSRRSWLGCHPLHPTVILIVFKITFMGQGCSSVK